MGLGPRALEGLGVSSATIDRAFWRGRRVFLTGHTGFKGSWMSLWLQALGAELTGYALAPATDPSLFVLARVETGMHSVTGDVRSLDSLKEALVAARPEVVIHMAAQPLVRESYRTPVETFATNVMGTVHLLEAVRHTPGVRSVVVVTTDKCYQNREWVWPYREDDPMGGHDPYSASKGCAELVTAAWRASFFEPAATSAAPAGADGSTNARMAPAVATARAGNVIGGGDWSPDRLVPDILAAFAAGRPVAIRNPQATRPWQHVLEPVGGYLLLAERLFHAPAAHAHAWNFGPEPRDVRPVRAIVDRMAALWGEGARAVIDAGDHPHEASLLALDIAKARHALGWQPRLGLDRALGLTVDWARAHARGEDLRAITLAQIEAYLHLPSTDTAS